MSSNNKNWKNKVLEDFLKIGKITQGSFCKLKDQITIGSNILVGDEPLCREQVFEKTVYRISKIDNHNNNANSNGKRQNCRTTPKLSHHQFKKPNNCDNLDRSELIAEIDKNLKHLHSQKRFLEMDKERKRDKTWRECLMANPSMNKRNVCLHKECHEQEELSGEHVCATLQKLLEKNHSKSHSRRQRVSPRLKKSNREETGTISLEKPPKRHKPRRMKNFMSYCHHPSDCSSVVPHCRAKCSNYSHHGGCAVYCCPQSYCHANRPFFDSSSTADRSPPRHRPASGMPAMYCSEYPPQCSYGIQADETDGFCNQPIYTQSYLCPSVRNLLDDICPQNQICPTDSVEKDLRRLPYMPVPLIREIENYSKSSPKKKPKSPREQDPCCSKACTSAQQAPAQNIRPSLKECALYEKTTRFLSCSAENIRSAKIQQTSKRRIPLINQTQSCQTEQEPYINNLSPDTPRRMVTIARPNVTLASPNVIDDCTYVCPPNDQTDMYEVLPYINPRSSDCVVSGNSGFTDIPKSAVQKSEVTVEDALSQESFKKVQSLPHHKMESVVETPDTTKDIAKFQLKPESSASRSSLSQPTVKSDSLKPRQPKSETKDSKSSVPQSPLSSLAKPKVENRRGFQNNAPRSTSSSPSPTILPSKEARPPGSSLPQRKNESQAQVKPCRDSRSNATRSSRSSASDAKTQPKRLSQSNASRSSCEPKRQPQSRVSRLTPSKPSDLRSSQLPRSDHEHTNFSQSQGSSPCEPKLLYSREGELASNLSQASLESWRKYQINVSRPPLSPTTRIEIKYVHELKSSTPLSTPRRRETQGSPKVEPKRAFQPPPALPLLADEPQVEIELNSPPSQLCTHESQTWAISETNVESRCPPPTSFMEKLNRECEQRAPRSSVDSQRGSPSENAPWLTLFHRDVESKRAQQTNASRPPISSPKVESKCGSQLNDSRSSRSSKDESKPESHSYVPRSCRSSKDESKPESQSNVPRSHRSPISSPKIESICGSQPNAPRSHRSSKDESKPESQSNVPRSRRSPISSPKIESICGSQPNAPRSHRPSKDESKPESQSNVPRSRRSPISSPKIESMSGSQPNAPRSSRSSKDESKPESQSNVPRSRRSPISSPKIESMPGSQRNAPRSPRSSKDESKPESQLNVPRSPRSSLSSPKVGSKPRLPSSAPLSHRPCISATKVEPRRGSQSSAPRSPRVSLSSPNVETIYSYQSVERICVSVAPELPRWSRLSLTSESKPKSQSRAPRSSQSSLSSPKIDSKRGSQSSSPRSLERTCGSDEHTRKLQSKFKSPQRMEEKKDLRPKPQGCPPLSSLIEPKLGTDTGASRSPRMEAEYKYELPGCVPPLPMSSGQHECEPMMLNQCESTDDPLVNATDSQPPAIQGASLTPSSSTSCFSEQKRLKCDFEMSVRHLEIEELRPLSPRLFKSDEKLGPIHDPQSLKYSASASKLESPSICSPFLQIPDTKPEPYSFAAKNLATQALFPTSVARDEREFESDSEPSRRGESPLTDMHASKSKKHSFSSKSNEEKARRGTAVPAASEDELLSGSQFVYIKEIDSEIQEFIKYLQNRLKNCDEMMRMQLKKFEEERKDICKGVCGEAALTPHPVSVALDDDDSDSSESSEEMMEAESERVQKLDEISEFNLPLDTPGRSTESDNLNSTPCCCCVCESKPIAKREEIPPFTGCECMREDYYKIMRLAYS